MFDFGFSPVKEVLADFTGDAVFWFLIEEWKAGDGNLFLAEADSLADVEGFNLTFEPGDDDWEVLSNDALAKWSIGFWELIAELVGKFDNLSLDGFGFDELFEVVDELVAHSTAEAIIFSWKSEHHSLLWAKAKLGADIEGGKFVFEPLHDLWNIGSDEGLAKSAVWFTNLFAELVGKFDDLFLGGFGFHQRINIEDELLAHVAAKAVFVNLTSEHHSWLWAKANLGADIEGGKFVFEPLHDLWNIGSDEGLAKSAVWFTNLFAELVGKFDDLFLGGFGFHQRINIEDELLAHVAAKAVISNFKRAVGLNSRAKLKLAADVDGFNLVFDPLHDDWDVLFNKSVAKSAIWDWEFVAKLASEFADFTLGDGRFHKVFDVFDSFLANFTAEAIVFSWEVQFGV